MQLITVGPVIDLYGKFAAIKLARMMKMYPGRVFSHPEFMALPPYVFSGADFALMPSRDEPFGLVAVEFGRKGVLCVGMCVSDLHPPQNLNMAWVFELIVHLRVFSHLSPFLDLQPRGTGADSKLRAQELESEDSEICLAGGLRLSPLPADILSNNLSWR